MLQTYLHLFQGTNNTYNGDFTHTFAVVMHNSAIGTIKRKDLVMESTYDPRRIGTLMTGRMLWVHGILRPESAVFQSRLRNNITT